MYRPKSNQRARSARGPGSASVVSSSTDVTFSGVTACSKSTGASALSRISTESKRETAAVGHVHRILSEQVSVLRRVFQDVDRTRDGCAPRALLFAGIIDALRLHPRWHVGLACLLDLTDPEATGSIIFGRLTRLVRTPFTLTQHAADDAAFDDQGGDAGGVAPGVSRMFPTPPGTAGTGVASMGRSKPKLRFDVADDGDQDLRMTFAGVNTGDKALLRRLGTPREMPPMAASARATNILGDSKVRAPWAVSGDDARMHHILTSIHKERVSDLVVLLRRHASVMTPDRLTFRQLSKALHSFDAFVHDAEVLQYFLAITNDAHQVSGERLQCADGSLRQSSGADESHVPAKYRRESVSIQEFVDRFGHNVLAAPAMRCSATFALKWTLPEPRGVAPRGRGAGKPAPPGTGSSLRSRTATTPKHNHNSSTDDAGSGSPRSFGNSRPSPAKSPRTAAPQQHASPRAAPAKIPAPPTRSSLQVTGRAH